VVIKTERSDKTEIKKFFLKISLIPPALLVVADLRQPHVPAKPNPGKPETKIFNLAMA
jgi:hypothetical protein